MSAAHAWARCSRPGKRICRSRGGQPRRGQECVREFTPSRMPRDAIGEYFTRPVRPLLAAGPVHLSAGVSPGHPPQLWMARPHTGRHRHVKRAVASTCRDDGPSPGTTHFPTRKRDDPRHAACSAPADSSVPVPVQATGPPMRLSTLRACPIRASSGQRALRRCSTSATAGRAAGARHHAVAAPPPHWMQRHPDVRAITLAIP